MQSSGIILPLFALPNQVEFGTLGAEAKNFVDFLSNSGQSCWQVDSPQVSDYLESFANDYSLDFKLTVVYLSLNDLNLQGLLSKNELESYLNCQLNKFTAYPQLFKLKLALLKLAFKRLQIKKPNLSLDFEQACQKWRQLQSLALVNYASLRGVTVFGLNDLNDSVYLEQQKSLAIDIFYQRLEDILSVDAVIKNDDMPLWQLRNSKVYSLVSLGLWQKNENEKLLSPVNLFLQQNCLKATNFDLKSEIVLLRQAMELGLKDIKSDLAMLPTYISTIWRQPLPPKSKIMVLDIGGSNLRTALVAIDPEAIEFAQVLASTKQILPGKNKSISYAKFLHLLVDSLLDYLSQSNKLAVCFSFAANIKADRSGEILAWGKEVHISGGVGSNLVEDLKKVFVQRKLQVPDILLTNDSVSALLSVLPVVKRQQLAGPIGIIHGTGFNAAWPVNIWPKLPNISYSQMLVNSEMGNYSILTRGIIDKYLDRQSLIPDDHILEKLLGGEYLGKIVALSVLAACNSYPDLGGGLTTMPELNALQCEKIAKLTNAEISAFLKDVESGNRDSELFKIFPRVEQWQQVAQIACSVYERAARILLIVLAAIADFIEAEAKPENKSILLAVLIEGSTFAKSYRLQEFFFAQLAESDYADKFVFLQTPENANLCGSALAWYLI